MKAVFNCRKKIGSLEQEYSSGSVEWPVERPGLSLRTAKEAIFTSSVVHNLRTVSDYRTPESCRPKSNWGTPRTKLEVVPCGSGPKFRIKTDVLLQLCIK